VRRDGGEVIARLGEQLPASRRAAGEDEREREGRESIGSDNHHGL
jgi:hypothetical protein